MSEVEQLDHLMSLDAAAIATNRFGLGARPGEMQAVAGDPRAWLEAQIAPERVLPAPLAALPSSADDVSAFRRWTVSIGVGAGARAATPSRGVGMTRLGGGRTMDPGGDAMSNGGGSRLPQGMTVESSFGQVLGVRYAHAAAARFKTAVDTDKPFFERWVRFWSNHFTVSAAKPAVVAMPPAFERDVIRRHAAGSFTEMLVASSRHPGMLTYLDQSLSIGPDSPLAHNPQVLPPYLRERMKGLNENLGREILELHTLGVRSGYTQDDVRALALMLTGWSARQEGAGASGEDLFRYLAAAHEPGPQTLLGKTYPDKGEEQALAALVDLSHHPATADHVAAKLARHFIADEPPPAAVARLSAAFRDSRGDLPTVAKAVVRSPEAWEPRLAKFKPPEDYLISAERALNAPPQGERAVVALLTKMGQRPNAPPGPDGWADVEGAWVGADPLWKRLEWATAASKGFATAGVDPAAIADAALGPQLTADTLHMIRAAESPAQGLAIFLVSPEFQRR